MNINLKKFLYILMFAGFLMFQGYNTAGAFDLVDNPTETELGKNNKFTIQNTGVGNSWDCSYGCYGGGTCFNPKMGLYYSGVLINTRCESIDYIIVQKLNNTFGLNNELTLIKSTGNKYILLNENTGNSDSNFSGGFPFFISGNILVRIENDKLKYYSISSDTSINLISTIDKPAGMVSPDMQNIPVKYHFPEKNGVIETTGFFYKGTDTNIYFFDIAGRWGTVGLGNTNGYLLGSFYDSLSIISGYPSMLYSEFNIGNTLLNIEQIQGNSQAMTNISLSCLKNDGVNCSLFNTGNYFTDITYFNNPKVYLKNSFGGIYTYNINCIDPLYSNCRIDFNDNKYYCTSNTGLKDPANIICDKPLIFTDTGGTTGGGSGSTTNTTGTEKQNCEPVAFSGGYTFETQTGVLLSPETCSFRTVNNIFKCQDENGIECINSGELCLKQIKNPGQYANSGTLVYNGDIIKYNCKTDEYICNWTGGGANCNNQYCIANNEYCEVKPEYLKKINTISSSGSYDLNITGGFGSGNGLNYNIGELTEAGTGVNCENMFSGSTFLYPRVSNTSFNLDFSNNFSLSKNPWTCAIFGLDICNFSYVIINGSIKGIINGVGSTANYLFNPILSNFEYIGEPQEGKNYCFFGEKFLYQGKIKTYYSFSEKKNIDVSNPGGFDYLLIIILIIIVFSVTFKK